jgi:DNA-binding transcriptional ArsR family regulator
MAKRSGTLVDERLAKVLSHPLRAHVLGILNDRVASPNEIAQELDEPLGNVSYHVRMLLDAGCIELVSTAQRRGAVEHFYRATMRPFFSDRDWKRLPPSIRQGISAVALQMIWEDTSAAINKGTFGARSDRHLSRTPLVLNEEGWKKLARLLTETLAQAMQIESESAGQLAQTGEQGFPVKLVLMHFESPADGPPERRRAPKAPTTGRRRKA